MKLMIDGAEIPQVLKARVVMTHNNSRDPMLVPIAEMQITTRLTESTLLANWAKAKAGKERFKRVELETHSRDASPQHHWVIPHGWISDYQETEFSSDITAGKLGVDEQLTGYDISVTIRAAMPGNPNYDGTNLIDVTEGTQSPN